MSGPRSILVCFAVKEEAQAFKALEGSNPRIKLLLTGMGKRNAEKAIRECVTEHPPSLVLSSGFAGGLNPELKMGDVLFDTDAPQELASAFTTAGARPGTFHCADRIATTPEEKRALRESTGADAVEMESQIVCSVCREHSIPAITARVILDTANEPLPLDFNQLMTPELRLDPAKLSFALMKAPGKIPALMRLQKQSREAAEQLAQVLSRFVRIELPGISL